MTLSLLEDNLREIYTSVPINSKDSDRLVSNFSQTRIYQKASGWGRFWTLFYYATRCFTKKDLKLEKLRSSIKKTDAIFKKHLNSLKNACKTYEKYFELKCLGVPTVEEKYHTARTKIAAWNLATGPFIELYTAKNEKKGAFFKNQFLFTKEQTTDLQKLLVYQQLIDLEGYLHEPLPLELFKKLSEEKPLEKKELQVIKKWIEQHNRPYSPLKIRPFHLALKAFLEITKDPSRLTSLEFALADLGLKVFTQKDPIHIEWRNTLKPGSVLQTSKGNITLEKQLGKKNLKEDNNLVFSIQGSPSKVVVIGINTCMQEMKKQLNEKSGEVIPSAKCLEIAPSGDFAIYERLQDPLDAQVWVSKKNKLDDKDLNVLKPIANLLQWIVKNQKSPQSLDPKYLMFDTKGFLKYSKVCIAEKFSQTQLEDFIFKCSKLNKTVFSYLSEASGLHDLPSVKFYQKIIKQALMGKLCNTSDSAAKEEISDPKIVDRADSLQHSVIKMKDQCKNVILERYHVAHVDALKNRIAREIWKFYNKTKLAGSLWPEMEEHIISTCANKEKLKLRESY